jgi:hypothetical protein
MDKTFISTKPTSKKDEKTRKAKSKRNFDSYTPYQAWKWIALKSGETKKKMHKGRPSIGHQPSAQSHHKEWNMGHSWAF